MRSFGNPYELKTGFDEVANLDKRGDLRDCVRCERHKSVQTPSEDILGSFEFFGGFSDNFGPSGDSWRECTEHIGDESGLGHFG